MAFIKLSAQERRRISVFFTCLVISGLAWVFSRLSNPYKYHVRKVLTFKNAPQKRAFHSLQPDTVTAEVRGTGWQMIFSKLNDENEPVTVDLHTLDSRNFVVLGSQLKQINDRRDTDKMIIAFDPDTLYFDFANRATKRVPVQLVSQINYQHQYTQSDDITIKPAYVTVSGPNTEIEKISVWKTDTLKIDSVDESLTQQVKLQPVSEGSMNVYPKSVTVTVPVDEFTEKTIEVPVKLINKGSNDVKIFPQKVKLTFTTTLSKYPESSADLFEAVADLDLWSKNGYSTLPVKLTRIPAYSKIIKVEPQNIDFIVKK